jgi:hypothetical protein
MKNSENGSDITKLLIDKGADIKIGTSGFSSLEVQGSDLKAVVSTKNKTPIYWTIEKNDLDLVMPTGFGPLKLKGKTDVSPAMYADIIGNKESKKYLLK